VFNLKNILTITFFKLTWVSCVFGEIYINSWFGLIIGIFYLIFFLVFQNERLNSLKIILVFSFFGYLFDSILSISNLYKIQSEHEFLFLPIWFLILWPCFSSLFVNVLIFLKGRVLLSIFLGAIAGPLSYYAGVALELVVISHFVVFFYISFFWSLLFLFYSSYNLKKI
jgi:hypothetical protein